MLDFLQEMSADLVTVVQDVDQAVDSHLVVVEVEVAAEAVEVAAAAEVVAEVEAAVEEVVAASFKQ
jgi:hypothetical protein